MPIQLGHTPTQPPWNIIILFPLWALQLILILSWEIFMGSYWIMFATLPGPMDFSWFFLTGTVLLLNLTPLALTLLEVKWWRADNLSVRKYYYSQIVKVGYLIGLLLGLRMITGRFGGLLVFPLLLFVASMGYAEKMRREFGMDG